MTVIRRATVAVGAVALLGATAVPGATRSAGISTTWRVYSARIDYDSGSYSVMPPGTRQLVIGGNRWTFGSSSGTVKVVPIAGADWKRWRIRSYGPTRRAVFAGWSGGKADGPIEEESGRADFIWVIYRAAPPVVHAPGTISLKFGRLRP